MGNRRYSPDSRLASGLERNCFAVSGFSFCRRVKASLNVDFQRLAPGTRRGFGAMAGRDSGQARGTAPPLPPLAGEGA
jgi:hypothetical protein